MNCIKCGRETQNDQVFCLDCQKIMAKYPVKPNTYVKLPERREPPRRLLKRRTISMDDQLRVLRHKVRRLTLSLLLCLILMAGMMYYIAVHISQDHYLPGQNYTVVTPSSEAQPDGPAE